MTPEAAERFLEDLRDGSGAAAQVGLAAAAQAFKLRPQFLRKQPRKRQAEWMRRALARPGNAAVAEEVLADFFLGSHQVLLGELLDALGVEHTDGQLAEEHPRCPDKARLEKALASFRAGEHPERRELLLQAFAAQSAINWPPLEALLGQLERQ